MSDSLRPHALSSPWNSPDQSTGVGYPFPSPGDLPNPGIKPRSPALQADSLPAEPPGKPPYQNMYMSLQIALQLDKRYDMIAYAT